MFLSTGIHILSRYHSWKGLPSRIRWKCLIAANIAKNPCHTWSTLAQCRRVSAKSNQWEPTLCWSRAAPMTVLVGRWGKQTSIQRLCCSCISRKLGRLRRSNSTATSSWVPWAAATSSWVLWAAATGGCRSSFPED